MFYIYVAIKVSVVLAAVSNALFIGCYNGWCGTECSKSCFIYRL